MISIFAVVPAIRTEIGTKGNGLRFYYETTPLYFWGFGDGCGYHDHFCSRSWITGA